MRDRKKHPGQSKNQRPSKPSEHNQRQSGSSPESSDYTHPMFAHDLPRHIMAMQALHGNSATLNMLSRMPDNAATPIIQRKTPKNMQEAMEITNAAGSKFSTKKPLQTREAFSTMRADAIAGFDELKSLTTEIAGKTGGKPEFRDQLKGMNRSWEKIVDKYKSNPKGLIDIIASKIVYKDFKDVYAAVDVILKEKSDKVVFYSDRFLKPVESGYSDIIMSVKLTNGHVAELRLHLASIDAIFKKEHELYEIVRSKGKEALSEDQKKEYKKLQGEYEDARKVAFDSLG